MGRREWLPFAFAWQRIPPKRAKFSWRHRKTFSPALTLRQEVNTKFGGASDAFATHSCTGTMPDLLAVGRAIRWRRLTNGIFARVTSKRAPLSTSFPSLVL